MKQRETRWERRRREAAERRSTPKPTRPDPGLTEKSPNRRRRWFQ